MKSVGVIVEYNPFHNGHFYHLQQAKKQTEATVVVAVMSGYFLQRGEPALVSKWERAKMALAGGADLVFELPYAYSTQKAETFAYGAISILDSLFVDEVCFGSESGSIDDFYSLIEFLQTHEQQYNDYIKKYVREGNSYPKSASLAFQQLAPGKNMLDLSQPNNILGFHYLRSIQKLNSNMVGTTIVRKAAQYHDETFAAPTIASATSIRKTLQKNQLQLKEIERVVPTSTYEILKEYVSCNSTLHDWETYFPFLKYKIVTMSEQDLQNIYEGEEGLEYRLKKHINSATTFSDFMKKIKTKRYTWNRLQRYCLHILTNTKKDEMQLATKEKHVPYLRLLGMTEVGQQYLHTIKKKVKIPIITKRKESKHPCFSLDLKAAFTYSLGYPQKLQMEKMKKDYQMTPIKFVHNKETSF